MKKSTRALVGLVVLDVAIALGAMWMVLQIKSGAMTTNVPPGEVITTITTTAGAAIGAITGLLLVVWFIRRRRGE